MTMLLQLSSDGQSPSQRQRETLHTIGITKMCTQDYTKLPSITQVS